MNRRAFDRMLAAFGAVLAGLLLVAGGLATWAHNFIDDQVHTQLAQQQIVFPAANNPQLANPAIGPYLTKYAGQQLTDGAQAKAFADHYIAVHLQSTAGGKTYSQLSAAAQANPTDAALAKQVDTMFKGETLRGMLLNAYAFWKMGVIASWAAIVGFVGAGVMMLLSGLGLWHSRRAQPSAVVFGEHERLNPAHV
jgi:hypothetical protein